MGDTDEGKPAQTNALAALFFARLYGVTGDPALSRCRRLDARLARRQPVRRPAQPVPLERPLRAAGRARRRPVRSERYFNYDQGIAIEALLAMAASTGTRRMLPRARAIGDSLHTSFWGRERGGYNLELGVEQVYTSYAAWASMGHLALYAADRTSAG